MEEALWSVVEAERLSLADLLTGLSAQQWQAQSLCSQWRVRDVAAHLAMTPTEPGLVRMLVGVARAHGNIWAFGRDLAREHARRPTDQIVAELRRDAGSRHLPPGTNGDNALLDVLVHGQDIARPLGIARSMPRPAAVASIHRAWQLEWAFHARRRLRGLRLVATDADVQLGDGALVEGGVADLLLVTGRIAAAAPRLYGPGSALLPVAELPTELTEENPT